MNDDKLRTIANSIAYHLYKMAGCPYGDDSAGLEAWIMLNLVEAYEEMIDRTEA